MDLRKRDFLAAGLGLAAAAMVPGAMAQPKPRRVNKVIELFEQGQPVYYQPIDNPSYALGRKMAKTYLDMINVEMEHGALDFTQLRAFMQGLVDGGPTPSGHRTPTVFVTFPALGYNEAMVRANSWMVQQALACGVHSVNLCHARDPGAVAAFIAAARYPFARPGQPNMEEGQRGSGSQIFASSVWGVSQNRYLHTADPWPLNPRGEIMVGVKLEDKYAVANCEKILALPGLTYAEWGPGDQVMSQLGLAAYPDDGQNVRPEFAAGGQGRVPLNPRMQTVHTRVLNAIKANKRYGLWNAQPENIVERIKEGWRIFPVTTPETAKIGRAFTKRTMPV